MIKLVPSGIPTYQMSRLPPPRGTKRNLDSKVRNLFWKGMHDKKNKAMIKWDDICRPKEFGRLGIKNVTWNNEVLGAKLVWRMFHEHKILYQKYLRSSGPLFMFWTINPPKGSKTWNFMMACWPLICKKLNMRYWIRRWGGIILVIFVGWYHFSR